MPIITEPGIYDNIPSKDYHGADITPVPALSCGVLKKLMSHSAKHAWFNHPALNPEYAEVVKDSFDLGTTAHALFLEGLDNAAVLDFDSYRTKESQQARELARIDGKVPMLVKDYGKVCEMVNVAKRYIAESELGISDLQKEGKAEQSIFWQEGGLWLKCRPDWMPNNREYILDYKTTETNVNPDNLAKFIVSLSYEMQDAFYRRGAQATWKPDLPFIFMFQEVKAPYACSLVSLSPEFTYAGGCQVERGIKLWSECLTKNQWPAFPSCVCELTAPGWMLAQEEARQVLEDMA